MGKSFPKDDVRDPQPAAGAENRLAIVAEAGPKQPWPERDCALAETREPDEGVELRSICAKLVMRHSAAHSLGQIEKKVVGEPFVRNQMVDDRVRCVPSFNAGGVHALAIHASAPGEG